VEVGTWASSLSGLASVPLCNACAEPIDDAVRQLYTVRVFFAALFKAEITDDKPPNSNINGRKRLQNK
jgi:hypothetical protein